LCSLFDRERIVLSGYRSILDSRGISVDWQVPIEKARTESLWIKAWGGTGKTPGGSPWQLDWLAPCLRCDGGRALGRFLYPCVVRYSGLALLGGLRREMSRKFLFRYVFFLLPHWRNFFWFFTAPEPRFAGRGVHRALRGIDCRLYLAVQATTRKAFSLARLSYP